jgi:hypothetical protein
MLAAAGSLQYTMNFHYIQHTSITNQLVSELQTELKHQPVNPGSEHVFNFERHIAYPDFTDWNCSLLQQSAKRMALKNGLCTTEETLQAAGAQLDHQ